MYCYVKHVGGVVRYVFEHAERIADQPFRLSDGTEAMVPTCRFCCVSFVRSALSIVLRSSMATISVRPVSGGLGCCVRYMLSLL